MNVHSLIVGQLIQIGMGCDKGNCGEKDRPYVFQFCNTDISVRNIDTVGKIQFFFRLLEVYSIHALIFLATGPNANENEPAIYICNLLFNVLARTHAQHLKSLLLLLCVGRGYIECATCEQY